MNRIKICIILTLQLSQFANKTERERKTNISLPFFSGNSEMSHFPPEVPPRPAHNVGMSLIHCDTNIDLAETLAIMTGLRM